jgi:hypothetical protein
VFTNTKRGEVDVSKTTGHPVNPLIDWTLPSTVQD